MALSLDSISDIAYNELVNKIRINYVQIKDNNCIIRVLPSAILYKLKQEGYIYYDELKKSLQYDVALCVFRDKRVLQYHDDGFEYLHYETFKREGYNTRPPRRLDIMTQDEVIDDFISYVKYNENVFTLTVDWEGNSVGIAVSSKYLDADDKYIYYLETDPKKYVINAFKNFIYTPNGTLPASPYYGTHLRKYLHTLSPNNAAKALKKELEDLKRNIDKILESSNNAIQINIEDVQIKISEVSAQLSVQVFISIGDTRYEITVKGS